MKTANFRDKRRYVSLGTTRVIQQELGDFGIDKRHEHLLLLVINQNELGYGMLYTGNGQQKRTNPLGLSRYFQLAYMFSIVKVYPKRQPAEDLHANLVLSCMFN
mgnify:CR=1 FL=1|tara:strand:+ start:399 stop:710 length:312 start_codon:yes stop_codon:yes gene_type:complete